MASNSNKVSVYLVAAVLCAVTITSAPQVRAAVSCGQVVNSLTPCVSYLANGGTVPAQCCNGVRSLYGMAQTTPDRQSICRCLKQAISGVSYSAFNLNLASGLPAKCGVNVPYKIDPSTNCDSIKRYD